MKTNLICLVLLFATVVTVNCESIPEQMDAAQKICLKEYNITEDDIFTTKTDLTCFPTCILVKAGILKDKKFNMDKYTDYLIETGDLHFTKEVVKAYEYCYNRMLDIRDECESMVQLEKCVEKQFYPYFKKEQKF